MATVREHLKKAHEAMAEHHRIMAKAHGEAMGKADDPRHGFHKSAKAEHEAAAQFHDDMCNECAKAAEGDLNKLVPHQVSAVYSQAVPRPGQPPLPGKPNVPLQFQKLVAVDEDEEIQLRS